MAEQQVALAPGIKQTEQGAPCMAADLHRMNETALTAVPAGFCIEEVATETALHDFLTCVRRKQRDPRMGWPGLGRCNSSYWDRQDTVADVCRLSRRPTGCHQHAVQRRGGGQRLCRGCRAFGLRGRGIGGAITLKPLLEARAEGFRCGVLFSTEMGQSVYERIGFQATGTRINRYLWRKA